MARSRIWRRSAHQRLQPVAGRCGQRQRRRARTMSDALDWQEDSQMQIVTSLTRSALAGAVATMLLVGCVSVPPVDPSALPVTPAAFKEGDHRWTAAAPAETQPRGNWWKAFADPE